MLGPNLYTEEIFEDNRGKIDSFNNLDLSTIKRTYFITHPKIQTVRAWQGHQHETKIFKVIKGRFIVGYVKIDNFEKPSEKLKAQYIILNVKKMSSFMYPRAMQTD